MPSLHSFSQRAAWWLNAHGLERVWTPSGGFRDAEERQRARVAGEASLVFLLLATFFAVHSVIAGMPRSVVVICSLGGVAFSVNLLLLRRVGVTPTAILFCSELLFLVFVSAATGGGLDVLAGPWNVVIPLLATYLLGVRGGMATGVVIFIESAIFYWLEKTGRLPPGRPLDLGTMFASGGAAVALITATSLLYESAHSAARMALAYQTELYEALLKTQADIGEGVVMLEGNSPNDWRWPVLLNAAIEQISGYSQQEIARMPAVLELVAPEERREVVRRIILGAETGQPVEATIVRKDGSTTLVEIAAKSYKTGVHSGMVALVRDVSERSRARAELERRAFFDDLTGLPNRSLFQDRLRQTLATSERHGSVAGLLLLDIDRFKEINDTFGHAAGDVLLQEIAERLRTVFRGGDTVARLGGDEFAFVLPAADASRSVAVAERIRKLLQEPIYIEGQPIEVAASIGIALYPEHGHEPDVLLRRADVAMYAAKRDALGHTLYEPGRDQNNAARLSMTAELRQAIEQGQLQLHYQPQVSLETGEPIGLEALARWPRPDGGIRQPNEFIPLAESTGMIRPLLAWSLGAALRDLKMLRQAGWELPVSVNLSMRNLLDPELPYLVATHLTSSRMPPGLLELELTESTLMADAARTVEVLGHLRSLGVRLAVDDFGTGYSSLAYLHRLPLDAVKLDKSFITGMRRERTSAAIVGATIKLAHSLDFKVIAEGVEAPEILSDLKALGCDAAQGYFMSMPLKLDQLLRWLEFRRRADTGTGLRRALGV